jgi:hypothetical protein
MAIVYIISPLFSFAIALLAFAHWFAWNIAHAHMHLRCYLWLDNWEVFRYLEWHHWLHHRYKNKNYNAVFPLADFIFGTSAKPTPQLFRASPRFLNHIRALSVLLYSACFKYTVPSTYSCFIKYCGYLFIGHSLIMGRNILFFFLIYYWTYIHV